MEICIKPFNVGPTKYKPGASVEGLRESVLDGLRRRGCVGPDDALQAAPEPEETDDPGEFDGVPELRDADDPADSAASDVDEDPAGDAPAGTQLVDVPGFPVNRLDDLERAGIVTVEQFQAYVDAGNDLTTLNGFGPPTAKKAAEAVAAFVAAEAEAESDPDAESEAN